MPGSSGTGPRSWRRSAMPRAFLATAEEFGTFPAYLANAVPGPPKGVHCGLDVWLHPGDDWGVRPPVADLRRRGFKLRRSTIVYAFMQSIGSRRRPRPGCFRYRGRGAAPVSWTVMLTRRCGRTRTIALLELLGTEVAEAAVAADPVVEDLDVVEHRGPGLGRARPGRAVDELGLEGGEEALGHGVVVAVADRAHGRRDAGLAQPPPEGEARVLASVVGVVDEAVAGRRRTMAMSRAAVTSSVRMWVAIDQPTTRRLQASRSRRGSRSPLRSAAR